MRRLRHRSRKAEARRRRLNGSKRPSVPVVNGRPVTGYASSKTRSSTELPDVPVGELADLIIETVCPGLEAPIGRSLN